MRTNVTRQFRSRERNVHYVVVSFPGTKVYGNETSRYQNYANFAELCVKYSMAVCLLFVRRVKCSYVVEKSVHDVRLGLDVS